MDFFPGDRVANGSIFGDLPPNPGVMVMSHDEGKEKKKGGSITIPMENKQENVRHWWKRNGCIPKQNWLCLLQPGRLGLRNTDNMAVGGVNSPCDTT